jgi:asparagine synthase (glutamine-hydrolysing)
MYFSAVFGEVNIIEKWQKCFSRYALWLNMKEHIFKYVCAEDKYLVLGWACNNEIDIIETNNKIFASTLGVASQYYSPVNGTQGISIEAQLFPMQFIVVMPPFTPEHLYYSEDHGSYLFTNDLRFHIQYSGLNLSEIAVYSLLQYETIPAPLTISKNIKRLANGCTLKLAQKNNKLYIYWNTCFKSGKEYGDTFISNLDELLSMAPRKSVLYYSGGVDSSLLAAHFKRMKRQDIKLINYIFSKDDKESIYAKQIATELGYECNQVMFKISDVVQFLNNVGLEYTYPFGDASAIPTYLLIKQSTEEYGYETVFEGTGADGLLGSALLYNRLKYFYKVPYMIRWFASQFYSRCKLYNKDMYVSFLGGKAKLSLTMPLLINYSVSIPLDGIAYKIPDQIREEINNILIDWTENIGKGLQIEEQLTVIDLLQLCSDQMACKSFDPLRRRGVVCVYPFLYPAIVNGAFKLGWKSKYGKGMAKYILKKDLEESISRDLIYRKKSGFVPPIKLILANKKNMDLIRDCVFSPSNLILDFVSREFLDNSLRNASENKNMTWIVYRFLWSVIFASFWLAQIRY